MVLKNKGEEVKAEIKSPVTIPYAQKLMDMFKEESEAGKRTFNGLVYGGVGAGKSHMVQTLRKPILVHSFDPGGSTLPGLRAMQEEGSLLVDTRFEKEDPKKPTVAKLWDSEFQKMTRQKIFDHLGTYVIDSASTWGKCLLNEVLRQANRAGSRPQQNDYGPQMTMIENAIRVCLSAPCDFILLGHDHTEKNDLTGKVKTTVALTGQLKTQIPLLFDEIYYMENRKLHTTDRGYVQARTRIGSGKFEAKEVPDISALLRKAGWEWEQKPLFK